MGVVMRAHAVRLRAVVAACVAALLASVALVAGPLAQPAQAAEFHVATVENFIEALEGTDGSGPTLIYIHDDLVFPVDYVAPWLEDKQDVWILGGYHSLTCAVENECEHLLVGENLFQFRISHVSVSGFKHAIDFEEADLWIESSLFAGNGTTLAGVGSADAAAVRVKNAELIPPVYDESVHSVRIDDTTFSGNTTSVGDGCAYAGAVHLWGDADITDSHFVDNHVAITDAGPDIHCFAHGGALRVEDGRVAIADSTFIDNSATVVNSGGSFADGSGGAIAATAVYLLLSNVLFDSNVATHEGGAISARYTGVDIDDGWMGNNSAYNGGAVYGDFTWLSAVGASFSGNSAVGSGGAVNLYVGKLFADETTFSGNSSSTGAGGAVWLEDYVEGGTDPSRIVNSAIYENSAPTGAGVALGGGTLAMEAVTVAHNTGSSAPGVYVTDAVAILAHVTIARNDIEEPAVDGIHAQLGMDVDGLVVLERSVLAEPGAQAENCGIGGDGLLVSEGYNRADDLSCSLGDATDNYEEGWDFDLGPLQFNGGPTWTILPFPWSDLVNEIPVDDCDSTWYEYSIDQRNVSRPQGDECDIGATEAFPSYLWTLEDGAMLLILNSVWANHEEVGVASLTPAAPAGVAFPFNGVSLDIEVWSDGWPVDVQYYTPSPTTQLWKLFEGTWQEPPGAISEGVEGGTVWSFRIVDGGWGDNDGFEDSYIEDPFAAGVAAAFTG